jgi:hypothetical protein
MPCHRAPEEMPRLSSRTPTKCPWGKEIESVSKMSERHCGEGAERSWGSIKNVPGGRSYTLGGIVRLAVRKENNVFGKSNLPTQILPFSQPNPDVTTVSLTRNAQLT